MVTLQNVSTSALPSMYGRITEYKNNVKVDRQPLNITRGADASQLPQHLAT
jgi:hypothetical protein